MFVAVFVSFGDQRPGLGPGYCLSCPQVGAGKEGRHFRTLARVFLGLKGWARGSDSGLALVLESGSLWVGFLCFRRVRASQVAQPGLSQVLQCDRPRWPSAGVEVLLGAALPSWAASWGLGS